MAKSCKCCKRIRSNAVANCQDDYCFDICSNPSCGDPKFLSALTPVIYDEIGINLCRSVAITDVLTNYPTAEYATAEVVSIDFATAPATSIVPIPSRPNCYEITLSNLSLTLRINIYDCCKRLLGTIPVTGVTLLPPATTDPSYDEDTNPTEVTLELFAPYGISYTDATLTAPSINFVGFLATNNQFSQGLNTLAIAKVLDFDLANQSATIGFTLIFASIYYNPYMLIHNGKATASKGTIGSSEETLCMEFVSGSLLDRNIKPLEIYNPFDKKEDCDKDDVTPCQTDTTTPFDNETFINN